MFFLLWPIQAQEIPAPAVVQTSSPQRVTNAETNYLTELSHRGLNPTSQGLLIESLDGSTIFADHQSDVAFNPASVIKLATSFTALQKFGPDFHFETAFYAAGIVDKKTRTLNGDLILLSTGDPVLSTLDVNKLVQDVIRSGIARVSGSLFVSGPFTYASYQNTPEGTRRLKLLVARLGLRVPTVTNKTLSLASLQANKISSHTSASLREILFQQNAHSVNNTAERVGEAVGGPNVVQDFLVSTLGIPAAEVHVGRTSGLQDNFITPRGTIHLLQEMVGWLGKQNLNPQDIMPTAGIDAGTLAARFRSDDYRGAVVGKTGTLPATDGGVSTLAGIIYTKLRGPILFAIFNTHGSVALYRQLQDNLLKELIVESGGPQATTGMRRSAN